MSKPHPDATQRFTQTGLIAYTLMAAISLCVELFAMVSFGLEGNVAGMVLAHLLLVSALGYWVWSIQSKGVDIGLPLLLTVMVGGLGVFGSVICLVVAALYAINYHNSVPFLTWFSELFPENSLNECEEIYERIIFGLDDVTPITSVEPFQDIFSYGTLQQKQTVLVKITRHFRPTFAPLLMRAVNDSDVAVRVQAATVVTKIERNFMEKTLNLEQMLGNDPSNIHKMKAVAALCDEYACSGILDAASEKRSRQKAINFYERCLALSPSEHTLKIALGRLYFQQNEPEKAYRLFKEYIDEHGLTSIDLVLWYMETLMVMGLYHKMRSLVSEYPLKFSRMEGEINQAEIIAIIQCWNKGVGGQRMCWGGGVLR